MIIRRVAATLYCRTFEIRVQYSDASWNRIGLVCFHKKHPPFKIQTVIVP